jgi:hypothetical protein
MAFIRDLEEILGKPKKEMPTGGAAGPRFAQTKGQMPARIAPGGGTSGAGGPLLVDYLRANVGAQPLAETTKELAQKAGRVQAQEYKGTTEGVKVAEAVKPLTLQPTGEGQATATGTMGPSMESAIKSYMDSQKPAFATPDEAAKAAMEVEATAEALGTEAGRQAVLQEKYGKGQTYTAGEAALDAALAGATSGRELSALAKKYGQLYETVTGKQQQAGAEFETQSAQAKADAQARAEATRAAETARAAATEKAQAAYDLQQRKLKAQERASVRYAQAKNAMEWAKQNNQMDAYRKFQAQLYAQELADEDYQNLVKGGKADDPGYFNKTYKDFLYDELVASGVDPKEAQVVAYGT